MYEKRKRKSNQAAGLICIEFVHSFFNTRIATKLQYIAIPLCNSTPFVLRVPAALSWGR